MNRVGGPAVPPSVPSVGPLVASVERITTSPRLDPTSGLSSLAHRVLLFQKVVPRECTWVNRNKP
jgi:hypothetical protein